MIAMGSLSVLAVGSMIIGGAIIAFLGGFVTGYVACLENAGKKALGVVGIFMLIFIAGFIFLSMSGCSPVVRESVTITDVEKKLPVPGDTVAFNKRSDTLAVEERDAPSAPPSWWVKIPGLINLSPESIDVPHANAPHKQVAFRAAVDTTVNGIRMRLAYRYPEDLWSVLIEQADREVAYRDRDTSGMRTVEGPARFPLWGYIVLVIAALMVAWSIFEKVKR